MSENVSDAEANAEAAWEEAQDLKEARASIAKQRAAAQKGIAAAGDDEAASYYREKCEERLLELAGKGSTADRARGEREWLALARKRLPSGDVWGLARVTLHLKMKRIPDEIVHELTDAWARDRLDKLCVRQERVDGDVANRWRADLVPAGGHEALLFARESYRRKHWAHVVACVAVVEGTRGDISKPSHIKADIKRNTRWAREHAGLLRIAALHFAGTPDNALLRSTIEATLKRAQKLPRDAYALPWHTLAALAIAQGLVDDPADAPLLRALASAWKKGDWLAAPALLAPRPSKAGAAASSSPTKKKPVRKKRKKKKGARSRG
jgi:hypothetical protein